MNLFNSLTKKKELFQPLKEGMVSMYTCGPTVYNYAHIGNFFAYLSADALYRWLEFGEGYKVDWVMNITDIDDKTIRDSKEKYPELEPMEALKKLCNFYEEAFFKDLESLNISKNSFKENPRATDYIEAQKELVQSLYDNGFAYVSEGSVYFDIRAYKKKYKYGRLVKIDEGFADGVRVDNDEYEKESAADFVLWKGRKEGEPYWDFELVRSGKCEVESNESRKVERSKSLSKSDVQQVSLPGRPGWHLECSAMEKEIFGLPFDIHTGGCDLKFPHHEDEIAQSVGAYYEEGKNINEYPTKFWVHNGHLMVEGEKMSKSKGNFFRLSDLVKEQNIQPDVLRLLMITNHYRKDFNFTKNGIHAMHKHIDDIREIYGLVESLLKSSMSIKVERSKGQKVNQLDYAGRSKSEINCGENLYSAELSFIQKSQQEFTEAMQDDLNTPKAFAIFLSFIKELRRVPQLLNKETLRQAQGNKIQGQYNKAIESIMDFLNFASNIFGVDFRPQKIDIPQDIIDLADKRKEARKNKDFAMSDALRDEIKEKGFLVEDKGDGYQLKQV
ncbi:cysteine--tRNA ligase [Candidatus Peregrinibacteria bacterium]|nr:cysteine--tRNA ligase [Candidatus Peregrinibacteria bacterium]